MSTVLVAAAARPWVRQRLACTAQRYASTTRGTATTKTYGLSGRSTGAAGCTVDTDTGFQLATDIPKKVGGANSAPQPVELLLASLIGCETATAHFVARHLWPRPQNKIRSIEWSTVVAERDERGALHLPIQDAPPVPAGLTRVSGVATVATTGRSAGGDTADQITPAQVQELGRIVEERCPVAAMMQASGVALDFTWQLAPESTSS